MALALLVLVGLAGAKIWVALSRGRTNIGFLIVMTLIFSIVAVRSSRPFRTARGNALLADLRTLFRRLKDRAGSLRPGGTLVTCPCWPPCSAWPCCRQAGSPTPSASTRRRRPRRAARAARPVAARVEAETAEAAAVAAAAEEATDCHAP